MAKSTLNMCKYALQYWTQLETLIINKINIGTVLLMKCHF